MKTFNEFLKEDTKFDVYDFVESLVNEFNKQSGVKDSKNRLRFTQVGPETFNLYYDYNSETYWHNKIKILNYDANNVKIYSSGHTVSGVPYTSKQFNSIKDFIKRINYEIFNEG